jgi:tetratricopeptide (TPR) repeat protein
MALAGLREARGDIAGAIESYEAVLAARPDSLIAVNNIVSLITDRFPEDPERLARAREIAEPLRRARIPHMQDSYGWLLHLSGEHEAALDFLVPAAEALPDNPWVRYHIGMVLAEIGQARAARGHLEAALELGAADFPPAPRIRARLAALEEG